MAVRRGLRSKRADAGPTRGAAGRFDGPFRSGRRANAGSGIIMLLSGAGLAVTLLGAALGGCHGRGTPEVGDTARATRAPAAANAARPTRRPTANALAADLVPVVEDWPNGKAHVRATLRRRPDGALVEHGVFTRWYEDGTKEYEATFRDGQLDGVETAWHANGQKRSEQSYAGGLRHGVRRSWDPQGRLRTEEHYEHDQPAGIWTGWDEKGRIKWQRTLEPAPGQPPAQPGPVPGQQPAAMAVERAPPGHAGRVPPEPATGGTRTPRGRVRCKHRPAPAPL